jgi:O-antigen ligase
MGVANARLAAHNTFFSILLEEGVIGFALFFALLITLVLSAWQLPHVERIFWLCILATWAVGALDLTWEDRKPTWFIFALLIAVTARRLAPEARLLRKQALSRDGAEFYRRTPMSAEISRS